MRPLNMMFEFWEKQEPPLDDRAMQQHARALAVTLDATRRAPLAVCPEEAFHSAMEAARSLAEETETLPAPLEWLCENGRSAEALFASLAPDRKAARRFSLPARVDGAPRIQVLLADIVKHSDAALTAERLTACLAAFDEVRALEMDELWAVPAALASTLKGACAAAARRVSAVQKDRVRAEKWLGAEEESLSGQSDAFFECALRRLHEQEDGGRQARLEKWLSAHDRPAERLIAAEHERQALERLRLDQMFGTLRMLNALDWSECFARISRVEKTLMRDPARTYPRMDDDSRAMTRQRVAEMARLRGVGEAAFANAALVAAEGGEGIRREVTWWLMTDEGARALFAGMGLSSRGLKRIHPDPGARAYRAAVLLLGAAFSGALFASQGALAALAVPAALSAASQVVNRLLARIRLRRLPRLALNPLPAACRTVVVVPALLSSPEQAAEMAFQLETLGCLEKDEGFTYVLLGDLPDASERWTPEDDAVLSAARDALRRANARAGRIDRYMLLTRRREFSPGMGCFIAPERKRGALNALMTLLTGGENAFDQPEAEELARRGYAFLITLDAGTKMLSGTAAKLVGTLAHPLNRARYAMLAPRMALLAEAVPNRFARLLGGEGGMDAYPTAVSDLWQDLAGEGNFGGKGVVDIAAFRKAMDRAALPENRILSHDLLEGLLADAGFIDDVTLFEGHPRRARAWFARLHRWTRGDWQLIGFIFRRGFSGLARWKLAANLIRSLAPASACLSLIAGFATGRGGLIAAGLVFEALPLLLRPSLRREEWERVLLRFSLLPHETWVLGDAAVRALYRLFVSGRRLLEWVTADDAERRGGAMSAWPCRLGALSLLSTVPANPTLILPAALIAALWASAPERVRTLEKPVEREPFEEEERLMLVDLARRTWRFFALNTRENGLTPDNVQIDPPRGAALRTSPTNIGLYLVGCVAACRLDLIDRTERDERLRAAVQTLERLEKWHGHLYNWYDIAAEHPLAPRFVSSVDSGNLAASLLLCAEAVEEPVLSGRLEALARAMDFTALYDEARKLFVTGYDAERERLSESHYDLLASESRILSFAAMMLGQVPCEHFARLGRACARVDGGASLISWGGTLFEYLMSGLFLPVWEDTLIGRTNRHVIEAQKARGRDGMPWGVSESGYYAFDLHMNYQYRAFGLSEAALRGERQESVVAPYASLLALPYDGAAVMENIRKMIDLGWTDEQGFFEAADFDPGRVPEGAPYRLVKSHMAHHQGMILASICNALTDDSLVTWLARRSEAAALMPLLQERDAPKATFAPLRERKAAAPRIAQPRGRFARFDEYDAHLLSGDGMLLACTAQGPLFARRQDGILVNPRPWSLAEPVDGFSVHVCAGGEDAVLTGGEQDGRWKRTLRFEPGAAISRLENERVRLCCALSVSPEDGAILQRVTLENKTGAYIDAEVTSCFRVALAKEADYEAHPAFQSLFVASESPDRGVLVFRRRPRAKGERWPALVHMAQETAEAAVSFETDLDRLLPRGRRLNERGVLAPRLGGTLGHVLRPCAALRVSFRLSAGEKRSVGFAIGLIEKDERDFRARHMALSGTRRAEELAATQAREHMRFLALNLSDARLVDRAAVLFLLPLSGPEREIDALPAADQPARLLWPLGLSGELPVFAVWCRTVDDMPMAREAARAHEYYLSKGLLCDLLLIDDSADDYEQPVRERLAAFSGRRHVHIASAQSLDAAQRTLLRATSAVCLESGGHFRAQLRAILAARYRPRPRVALAKSDELREGAALAAFNGWGGFAGDDYVVTETDTPAPWCNILCNERFGSMVTEHGDSFTWLENSRNGRLTLFDNDPHGGGSGEHLRFFHRGRVYDAEGSAARVTHAQGESVYDGLAEDLAWRCHVFVDCEWPVKCHRLILKNEGGAAIRTRLEANVEWIMGVNRRDARYVRTGGGDGVVWARGQIGSAAFMALTEEGARVERGLLRLEVEIAPGEARRVDLLLGCGSTMEEIDGLIAAWRGQGGEARLRRTTAFWHERLSRAEIATPDPLLNVQLNRFLPRQVLCARLYGRAGWYQPGGAYGFRDQLQDQLSQLLTAPAEARAHILRCAAHQFEGGDVQHWWHAERTGVRTRISDDMLFLPFVTGCYVAETGDESILEETAPFLKDVEIPEGRADWYGEAAVSGETATLREHGLRAIMRASRTGAHGLLLMGSGDWNDGMNRVGTRGRGESVWLTEFMIATIRVFAPCCGREDGERLEAFAESLREALEREAWDGAWYLRAFDDEGEALGGGDGAECRLDSLPQSWAVLAGLDPARCDRAMDAVRERLIDREHGLIRLLTPPFDGLRDAGYIGGYPPGIRENGGQYTHAACWVVLALARLGRAEEAWEAFRMLLPASHGDTREKEENYRVEPYVMAADVYDGAPHAGRGGWTWYTGAAAWMLRAAWVGLMGLEKRGDAVRMRALLPKAWNEVSAVLRVGGARYQLTSSRNCEEASMDGRPCPEGVVHLKDDGREHRAVFPARNGKT